MQDILSTVEVSLLPFNLSLLRGNLAEHRKDAILRARHDLILQYQRETHNPNMAFAYFVSLLKPNYFKDQATNLKQIRRLWRKIERFTIGSYYSSLFSRLYFRDQVFSPDKFFGMDSEEELEGAIGKVISYTTDDLFNRLAERSIPVAIEFFRELKSDAFINTRRAPRSIWFENDDGLQIGEQIQEWQWVEDDDLLERVWGKKGFIPYDVFGMAAAFALFTTVG
ncbi:MAG: hypothetical protein V7727_19905 [Sneathiella sp.]